MSFGNFETSLEGDVIQSVRKLAKSAADAGNDASLSQLAAVDKAPAAAGAGNVRPEAEDLSLRDGYAVEMAGRDPEVVNFASLQIEFRSVRAGVEQRARFREDGKVTMDLLVRKSGGTAVAQFSQGTAQSEAGDFASKQYRLPPGGKIFFRSFGHQGNIRRL